MTFNQGIEEINLLILNGRLEGAWSALQVLKPTSKTESRTKGHFEGILLFHKEQYVLAKAKMEETRRLYGDNVNLLRDLCACLFQLGEMSSFRHHLHEFSHQLRELEPALSPRTLRECELMVGKFLEEDGRIAPARDFYERALSRLTPNDIPPRRLRVLIQLARWHALYGSYDEELSRLYSELISSSSAVTTVDLKMELEHSLALIELHLIGAAHAWQRIQHSLPDAPPADQRLMVFDYIEGILTRELEVAPDVLQIAKQFHDLNSYEDFLVKLAEKSLEGSQKILKLTFLAAQIPWASYLRILCLSANSEIDKTARIEITRKINLILKSLDEESQRIWKLCLNEATQTPEIQIEYSMARRRIQIHGKTVDLQKKKIGLQILGLLSESPAIPIETAISDLWEASFTPEHYHRLRMSVHRLNTLIHKYTGLGKIIEVDSQSVKLRPQVKILKEPELSH